MTKFSLRLPLLGLAVLVGVGLLLASSGRFNSPLLSRGTPEPVVLSFSGESGAEIVRAPAGPNAISGPVFQVVAAVSFDGDLRRLAKAPATDENLRPELELDSRDPLAPAQQFNDTAVQPPYDVLAPAGGMPAPLVSFDGVDHATGLGGWPPDTNGDVGPNHYIQTVNTAIGIYSKTGTPLAVTTFNALFDGTGTPCDSNNKGDPVVLYDKGYDRWLVTDFAWINNDTGPYYECLAASKTGDPVAGGWWFYALRADDPTHNFLNDYPKLGVWTDGIYMAANMFDCQNNCGAGTTFQASRVWALNRTDMFTGAALRVVHFDTNSSVFTLLPSNFRGAAPPAGAPNYFVTNDQGLFALDVFKFHVNWASPASSTFTGPTQVGVTSFSAPPALVLQPAPGNGLDSLGTRLMVQNQYKKVGGAESLWLTHAVGVSGKAAVRWYQLNVTSGSVAGSPVQQSTFQPDTTNRWMPSLAVDRVGNMAIGYSLSSATISPTIAYAGRLVSDTLNTLAQGETPLIAGTGVQNNTCGGPPCKRWGDYSAMTMDPVDDCTFWYTTEYYDNSDAVAGINGNWRTRIGSFQFPGCVQVITYTDQLYLPLVTYSGPSVNDGWTTLMQEGFEGVWPSAGWTVSDFASNQRIWGKSNCKAASGSNSAWAIGGGSVGVGLPCGSSYPSANVGDWMIYGPFSLAGATEASLKLDMLTNIASGDSACWMASTNGTNFNGFCLTSSTSNTFFPETLDMTGLVGQPTVWIAIYFETNSGGSAPEGAYVDNLLLRACFVAACSDPSGPSQPAAAGDVVPFSITLDTGAARP